MRTRIAVLVSGSGSNLQALLDAGDLGGDLVLVASDNPRAGGIDRAAAVDIPTAVVASADHPDRVAWEGALCTAVQAASPDLVVLAGFMKILSPGFVSRWPIVNVHPSLLPAFAGARAPADAIAWGVKVSGVTVHFVDEQVDHGPIIAQQAVSVEPDDTPETLHARIQAVEHRLLPAVVTAICQGRVDVVGRRVRVKPEPAAPPHAMTPSPRSTDARGSATP